MVLLVACACLSRCSLRCSIMEVLSCLFLGVILMFLVVLLLVGVVCR